MTTAVVLGALVGVGLVGAYLGMRVSRPSLGEIASAVLRPVEPGTASPLRARPDHRAGGSTVRGPATADVPADGPGHRTSALRWRVSMAVKRATTPSGWSAFGDDDTVSRLSAAMLDGGRWWSKGVPIRTISAALGICGVAPEQLVSRMIVFGGMGLLAPPVLWAAAAGGGIVVPLGVAVLLAAVATPTGVVFPVLSIAAEAKQRRRHFRIVLSTYVDLVVLSLAGGVGVEGALLASSSVTTDWAAARMARALAKARDTGQSPWVALGELGDEVGVTELVELSTTLQLAGTEGARIRQSLSARAVSLRRHEQADAESVANAMTERLFLPGALLLIGFLIFVGYPAVSRILGGI